MERDNNIPRTIIEAVLNPSMIKIAEVIAHKNPNLEANIFCARLIGFFVRFKELIVPYAISLRGLYLTSNAALIK